MAGNVDEAVTAGRNGWVLPVRNIDEYRVCLDQVFSTSIEMLEGMGRISKTENARFWDTIDSVSRFLDVLLHI
jgi:hypothetical protein